MRVRSHGGVALVAAVVAIGCGSSNAGSPEVEAGADATTSDGSTTGGDAAIGPSEGGGAEAGDAGGGDAVGTPLDASEDASDATAAADASDASSPSDASDAANDASDAGDAGDAAEGGAVVYVFGVTVSTLAESDVQGSQDGTGAAAQFDNPTGLAIDAQLDLIVTDYDGADVRLVTPLGVVTTIANATGFVGPFSVALSTTGGLYVGTDFDSIGTKYPTSGTIWNIVPLSDGGVATPSVVAHGFGRPRGLAPVAGGDLVFSDRFYSTMQYLTVADGGAAFLAGTGDAGYSEGTGAGATFNMPLGAATLPNGDVLVADTGNNRIRRVTSAGVVTTFAGDGVAAWTDGPIAGAELSSPRAVAVDAAGNVYVSDAGNQAIRRILASGTVDTLAGDGTMGFQNGAGSQAEFYGQEGIAVTPDGKTVYVTDGNSGDGSAHHRVRAITVP